MTTNTTEELNVDFENFSLPKERCEELRTSVQKVKEMGIVDAFRSLVQELGMEEISSQENQMAGLIKAKNPKVFRYPIELDGQEPKLFEVFQFEQELRATLSGNAILEVSFLPKDKDFVLFYVATEFLNDWPNFSQSIAEVVRESEKMKNDRSKHFKKFKKEIKHEEPNTEITAD